MIPEQTKHIRPVNPTSVQHLLNNNHDEAIHSIRSFSKTSKTDEVNETYWIPTSRNLGNEKVHTPIQPPIVNKLGEVKQLEQLKPQKNVKYRTENLYSFNWTDSTLELEAKQTVETLSVEFNDILHNLVSIPEVTQKSKSKLNISITSPFKAKAFHHQSSSIPIS